MINLKDFQNTILTPVLISERGVGKTQFIKDYCIENNLELFTLNLASIESSDFTGLPYIENNQTKYAAPIFFQMKKGILFLDEINRVSDNDVKSALHSLLLDRSINGHVLSNDVQIVGAGNPVNENYETFEFDSSLSDRLVMIDFNYSYKDFIKYLKSKIKTIPFINFLENNESVFESISRRRIFELSRMIEKTENDTYIKTFLNDSIFNLYNAFNSKRLFNLENVLNGDTTKDVVGIQSVTQDLIKYMLNDFDKDKSENINKFLTNIPAESKLLFFQSLKESDITESQVNDFLDTGVFKKLGKYIKELF